MLSHALPARGRRLRRSRCTPPQAGGSLGRPLPRARRVFAGARQGLSAMVAGGLASTSPLARREPRRAVGAMTAVLRCAACKGLTGEAVGVAFRLHSAVRARSETDRIAMLRRRSSDWDGPQRAGGFRGGAMNFVSVSILHEATRPGSFGASSRDARGRRADLRRRRMNAEEHGLLRRVVKVNARPRGDRVVRFKRSLVFRAREVR